MARECILVTPLCSRRSNLLFQAIYLFQKSPITRYIFERTREANCRANSSFSVAWETRGSLSCSAVLPPAYPILYLDTCTHTHTSVTYTATWVCTYSCALRHSPQFRIPVYLTRNRNEEEEAKLPFLPPDDLSLSVDYHRACANASTGTQERARHACIARSPWELHNAPPYPLSRPALRMVSAVPVHPPKSFTCPIETQD